MHRLADGNHLLRADAAVVAGDQHRPFRERHEERVVHLELDRELQTLLPGRSARLDVGLEVVQHRGRRVGSKRATLKLVGRPTCSTFFGSSCGRNAWGSGLASVISAGLEPLPDRRIGVAVAQVQCGQPGNAPQVRQRRHVHDREAGPADGRCAASGPAPPRRTAPPACRARRGRMPGRIGRVRSSRRGCPGSGAEVISSSPCQPLIGKRTRVPSRLIRSAVSRVHTSDTRWPAMSSLVPSSEPYEAPRMRTLRSSGFLRLGWPCGQYGPEVENLTVEISQCQFHRLRPSALAGSMSRRPCRKSHFLGVKLRALRKRNGLTLEELSARCIQLDSRAAPSVSYLSMIEGGKRVPSEDVLADPVDRCSSASRAGFSTTTRKPTRRRRRRAPAARRACR